MFVSQATIWVIIYLKDPDNSGPGIQRSTNSLIIGEMIVDFVPSICPGEALITALESDGSNPRNIQTTLKYWRTLPESRITIDFRNPGAEEQFDELENLEEAHPVVIHDIRGTPNERFTLGKNGFQYIDDPVPEYDEMWDEKRVESFFLPRTEALVRDLTGATRVLVYTHRIRCQPSGPRSPAHIVHADFTPAGALQHLRTLLPPSEFAHLQETDTRILALNIWRPLQTVTKDPLAVCDWSSISPEAEIVPNRFIFSDGWSEVAKVLFSKRHRWWYCSSQCPDEVVVFKQYDSAEGERGSSVVHSAFVDPDYEDDEPRRSLEVGVFVFLQI
ncbi:hypothetical protein BJX63DRAFT_433228 [Aspergillus granulosus]|uniref:Uncharacterized protein n=1 Tax=Aspergillus granulosus TaxID=176169 RepID=A0ABR4H8D8_9EURO